MADIGRSSRRGQ